MSGQNKLKQKTKMTNFTKTKQNKKNQVHKIMDKTRNNGRIWYKFLS